MLIKWNNILSAHHPNLNLVTPESNWQFTPQTVMVSMTDCGRPPLDGALQFYRRSSHQVLQDLLRSFPSMPPPPLYFSPCCAPRLLSVCCLASLRARLLFVCLFVPLCTAFYGLKGLHLSELPVQMRGGRRVDSQGCPDEGGPGFGLLGGCMHYPQGNGLAVTQQTGSLCGVRENINPFLWAVLTLHSDCVAPMFLCLHCHLLR